MPVTLETPRLLLRKLRESGEVDLLGSKSLVYEIRAEIRAKS